MAKFVENLAKISQQEEHGDAIININEMKLLENSMGFLNEKLWKLLKDKVNEVKEKNISCILVKDMFRFSREYIGRTIEID